jgi:hypothetical protein
MKKFSRFYIWYKIIYKGKTAVSFGLWSVHKTVKTINTNTLKTLLQDKTLEYSKNSEIKSPKKRFQEQSKNCQLSE